METFRRNASQSARVPAIHAVLTLEVLLLLSLTGARGYLMESGPQAKIRKVETTQVWKVWHFNTIRFLHGWINYGSGIIA